MDFFDVVNSRRSIRKYKPDQVSRDIVMKILHAANQAPSAMNLQQWEFLVITGERIGKIGESYKKAVEDLIQGSDPSHQTSLPPANEFIEYARALGGAPMVIVILTEASDQGDMRKAHLESASAAMQNLVLSATAMGLGSCWMTGPLRREHSLRSILGVPDSREIVALTPLGYPAETPPPRARKDPDLSQKVQWLE
jgi:nitroreductase